MFPKYRVEFNIDGRSHKHVNEYETGDPVALEDFLVELLEKGMKVISIHHKDEVLPAHQFDGLIKKAAEILVSKHVCTSLGIDSVEAHKRFGFPA